MGVVEILGSYNAAEEVIRDADYALYQSKIGQRATVVEFDPSLREEAAKQRELQAALRGAITRGEMFVEYQPICRIRNGELVGFEALVRWQRNGHALYPSDFIPLAERSGLVCDVDRYVADVACEQMAQWHQTLPDLRLELNASALHFEQPGAMRDLTKVLRRHNLQPETLDIELTESSLVGLTDEAVASVRDLHSEGIRLHLDDFGTGYSSLTYLQRLHVDAVKIDRSFVEVMLQDDRAMQIVHAIVNLAWSLGVEVIAEGVTTPEEALALEKLGVTLAQGYLYARPLPAEDAQRLVEQRFAQR
jgi:EAL domain-containing protein (putative c-di-GMP-specific phosphodiesterase class I)